MADLRYGVGEDIDSTVIGFPTGLVGVVAVQIVDSSDNPVVLRSTAGITESPAGSGRYHKKFVGGLTLPDSYRIIWDRGPSIGPSGTAEDTLEIVGTQIASDVVPGEILATLSDINANLDGEVIVATNDNTALAQISVARVIRAYLSRIYSNLTIYGWDSPANTPDIIREIAGKLIAAQLYIQESSTTSLTIDERNFAQLKYDQAMQLLRDIISGTIIIPNVDTATSESLVDTDYFPVDATDRAFTMSQVF